MSMTVKFTPKGGSAFEVPNVLSVSWEVSRNPAANGQLGQRNHNIGHVTLTRRKAPSDAPTVKLAAALENKAYFAGSVVVTSSDDSSATVDTVRWDQGHICSFQTHHTEHGTLETMSIATTGLKVGDSEFKAEKAA